MKKCLFIIISLFVFAANINATNKIAFAAEYSPIGEGVGLIGNLIRTGAKFLAKQMVKSGTKLTKSQLKSISSLERQIAKHETKLAEYIKDPMKFDNKGFLKNAPTEAIREKIINTRINNLNKEIQKFKNEIQKIQNGL
jgi:polyhydroxyalkanoate synthesis regulator phasin